MKTVEVELPLPVMPWEATLRLRCLELAAELRTAASSPASLTATADEFLAYVLRTDTRPAPPAAGAQDETPSDREGAGPGQSSTPDTSKEPGRSPESRADDAGRDPRGTVRPTPGTRSEKPRP